jgi:hypothetical protein
MNRPPIKRLLFTAAATVAVGAAQATPAGATSEDVAQTAPVNWHAQSGNEGPVGAGAEASLTRTAAGVSYEITTTNLVAGNAYTVWFVVVNDPGACSVQPCPPPEIIGEAAVDGQVTWGYSGLVAGDDGAGVFSGEVAAGPLLDGWLAVQGLDAPLAAEIHLVLHDHGPVIPELEEEMVTTYRAGCADTSPFPEFFPPTAFADGTPGPNNCVLYQAAVFASPAG